MNRVIYPASVYPVAGDVVSQPGSTQVRVTGIQGVAVSSAAMQAVADLLIFDPTSNTWIPRLLIPSDLPIATTSAVGAVEPDGTTLTVSGAGKLSLATPVTVADGGTGTASPALIAGANINVAGVWPDQTVAVTSTVNAALNGSLGATTPSTVVATTGVFSGNVIAENNLIVGTSGTLFGAEFQPNIVGGSIFWIANDNNQLQITNGSTPGAYPVGVDNFGNLHVTGTAFAASVNAGTVLVNAASSTYPAGTQILSATGGTAYHDSVGANTTTQGGHAFRGITENVTGGYSTLLTLAPGTGDAVFSGSVTAASGVTLQKGGGGVLTFQDGTTQSTAATGSGSAFPTVVFHNAGLSQSGSSTFSLSTLGAGVFRASASVTITAANGTGGQATVIAHAGYTNSAGGQSDMLLSTSSVGAPASGNLTTAQGTTTFFANAGSASVVFDLVLTAGCTSAAYTINTVVVEQLA